MANQTLEGNKHKGRNQVIGAKAEIRETILGRPCHIVVDDSDGSGSEFIDAARAELQRLTEKFSSSHPDSVISQINASAGSDTVTAIDPETDSLFNYVSAMWEQSRHMFDPSTRILSECYNGRSTVDGIDASLKAPLQKVGWSKLEFTDEGVRLPQQGMSIDLNSCIRPYAADRTCKLLASKGAKNIMIDLGNDIATSGKQPDGANWLVGIRHPRGSRTAITRIKLNDKGYAIRGDFENTLTFAGERFSRALSPVDGKPVPGLLTVAVVADSGLEACTAANIARLKTEPAAIKWLDSIGLQWLGITRDLQSVGPLAPSN